MKKVLLFFCVYTLLYNPGYTQISALDLRDMSGRPIAATNSEIKGSPFLNDKWGTGYVKLGNGRVIKDIFLRFNLFSNELNYKVDEVEFALTENASEFFFSYEEEGISHQVLFRNGYPGAKPATAKLFFEVMADGPRFQLLKRSYKSVSESYGYGSAPVKAYRQESEIFIYDAQLGSISLVKNKQPLGESVPELAKIIAALPGNENGKFKSEKELVNLFVKLNPR